MSRGTPACPSTRATPQPNNFLRQAALMTMCAWVAAALCGGCARTPSPLTTSEQSADNSGLILVEAKLIRDHIFGAYNDSCVEMAEITNRYDYTLCLPGTATFGREWEGSSSTQVEGRFSEEAISRISAQLNDVFAQYGDRSTIFRYRAGTQWTDIASRHRGMPGNYVCAIIYGDGPTPSSVTTEIALVWTGLHPEQDELLEAFNTILKTMREEHDRALSSAPQTQSP